MTLTQAASASAWATVVCGGACATGGPHHKRFNLTGEHDGSRVHQHHPGVRLHRPGVP